MKWFLAVASVALALAIPASSTDNLPSPYISGLIPVSVYATHLIPGGSYTPEWKVFQSDTDSNPFTYFRSPVVADSNGNLTSSVPLQILSNYGSFSPYVIEMSLLQPDSIGFLQPVYDSNGHVYCVRVYVWSYAPSEGCN